MKKKTKETKKSASLLIKRTRLAKKIYGLRAGRARMKRNELAVKEGPAHCYESLPVPVSRQSSVCAEVYGLSGYGN